MSTRPDHDGTSAELAMAISNLLVAARGVRNDPLLANHPSAEWMTEALTCLWRALGFCNNDTALGIFDLFAFEILDEWPADATEVAICHSQPIYAIDLDGTTLFASRTVAYNDERTIWSSRLSFAMALLCATIGRPCSRDALSMHEGVHA